MRLEQFNFRFPSSIDEKKIRELASLRFLERHDSGLQSFRQIALESLDVVRSPLPIEGMGLSGSSTRSYGLPARTSASTIWMVAVKGALRSDVP